MQIVQYNSNLRTYVWFYIAVEIGSIISELDVSVYN